MRESTVCEVLLGELFASCKQKVSRYTCGELVPLGIKWSCHRALGNCARRICARCDANTNKRQRHLI